MVGDALGDTSAILKTDKQSENKRREASSSPTQRPRTRRRSPPIASLSGSSSFSTTKPKSRNGSPEDTSPDPPRTFLRLNSPRDMEHFDAQAAILHPFRTDYLPPPTPNAPLFLPADAERHWFLGYIYRWHDFNPDAIEHWNRPECTEAFRQLQGFQVDLPRATSPSHPSSPAPASLESHFTREVLEPVEKIYNTLLTTRAMRDICGDNLPQGIWLESTAQNEELSAKGVKPAFIVRSKAASGKDEMRLVGHAEYLGGRPGALTLAIKNAARNTWGSLRCILGDVARWMLECNTEYGFLVSSDEMFLRFAIVYKGKKLNVAEPGEPPRVAFVYTMVEPHVYYSDPIKHSDVLDERTGTVTVRLALLFLLHTTVMKRFQMPKQKGNATEYFPTTEAGKKFML